LRRPAFPILEQIAQRFVTSGKGVTQEEFAGSGRRARPGIKKNNFRLAIRERTVNKWQIPMTAARKPKPKPDSTTTRKRETPERGTTSPSPA